MSAACADNVRVEPLWSESQASHRSTSAAAWAKRINSSANIFRGFNPCFIFALSAFSAVKSVLLSVVPNNGTLESVNPW